MRGDATDNETTAGGTPDDAPGPWTEREQVEAMAEAVAECLDVLRAIDKRLTDHYDPGHLMGDDRDPAPPPAREVESVWSWVRLSQDNLGIAAAVAKGHLRKLPPPEARP